MKNLRPGLLVCSFLLFFGCRNQDESRVHQVWDYIKERPDSALTVLNEYDLADFRSRRSQAEFALLKSIALDKSFIDLQVDTLIRPALEYYEKWGNDREKMLSWYYLGRVQVNAKEYNDAIVSISKAEEYSTRTDDLFQQGLIHMAKENIYSFCYNNSEARHEALQGIDAFEKINEKTLALKAKRKLAMDDVALKDFHHADSILLSIINREDIDSSFYARCLFNYAWSKTLQEDYAEAINYYNIGANEYHGKMTLPEIGMFGVAHIKFGDSIIAEEIMHQLASIPSARTQYLRLCYERSLAHGDLTEALQHYQGLIAIEDSIAIQTMEQSIIKSQRDYQRQSSEVFRLQSERRKLSIIAILFAGFFAIVIFYWAFRTMKSHYRKEKEILLSAINEAKRLTIEADEKSSALNDELILARKQYVEAYKKRFSKIAHVSEIYYQTSGSKNARELVYKEVRDLSSFITKDTRTYRQLEKSINAGLSDSMEWYRTEYPGQEEKNYRFVCYLMAGFPASTISLLTGLSTSNVYVRKNRLLDAIRNGNAAHKDLFILVLE